MGPPGRLSSQSTRVPACGLCRACGRSTCIKSAGSRHGCSQCDFPTWVLSEAPLRRSWCQGSERAQASLELRRASFGLAALRKVCRPAQQCMSCAIKHADLMETTSRLQDLNAEAYHGYRDHWQQNFAGISEDGLRKPASADRSLLHGRRCRWVLCTSRHVWRRSRLLDPRTPNPLNASTCPDGGGHFFVCWSRTCQN